MFSLLAANHYLAIQNLVSKFNYRPDGKRFRGPPTLCGRSVSNGCQHQPPTQKHKKASCPHQHSDLEGFPSPVDWQTSSSGHSESWVVLRSGTRLVKIRVRVFWPSSVWGLSCHPENESQRTAPPNDLPDQLGPLASGDAEPMRIPQGGFPAWSPAGIKDPTGVRTTAPLSPGSGGLAEGTPTMVWARPHKVPRLANLPVRPPLALFIHFANNRLTFATWGIKARF